MPKSDPALFHKLYGLKKPRVTYYEKDFLDYVLMMFLSALVLGFSYGFGHAVSIVGLALSGMALSLASL